MRKLLKSTNSDTFLLGCLLSLVLFCIADMKQDDDRRAKVLLVGAASQ